MTTTAKVQTKPAPKPSFTPARTSLVQRKCACGGKPGPTGRCEECRRRRLTELRYPSVSAQARDETASPAQRPDGTQRQDRTSSPVQPKMTVNAPGDAYEQEADRIAGQVLRMVDPKPTVSKQSRPGRANLQRTEAASTRGVEVPSEVAQGIGSLRGKGSPLDPSTRGFMESRFGHDFGRVRVHTDAPAADLARQIDAVAFTTGQDVVFDTGRYAPETTWGKRILAHELAHVVQQSDRPAAAAAIFRLSPAMCSKAADCGTPDTPGAGGAGNWMLTLAVDREEQGLGRLVSGNVGHTWVKLRDDTGEKYSYGFWPQTGFDSSQPQKSVPGCVHHPDTAHEPPAATSYIGIDYKLAHADYLKAIGHAESVCRTKPAYNLFSYNCTTFAIDVARAAGVSPPASTTLAIHNPNALYEGIEEELKTRGTAGSGSKAGKKTP